MPEYIKRSSYSIQIEIARNIFVVLHDVASQREWLVDGVSALLHVVRSQVVRKPYDGSSSLFNNPNFNCSKANHPKIDGGLNTAADTLEDERKMKHVILWESDSYIDETIAILRPEAESKKWQIH